LEATASDGPNNWGVIYEYRINLLQLLFSI
jgi:hypothetical protein